jgi:hypothetical protein
VADRLALSTEPNRPCAPRTDSDRPEAGGCAAGDAGTVVRRRDLCVRGGPSAKGAPAWAIGSPRISPTDDDARPAHLLLLLPPLCSPERESVPLHRTPGLWSSPSVDQHHGVFVVMGTLHNRRRNPGHFGLQFGCSGPNLAPNSAISGRVGRYSRREATARPSDAGGRDPMGSAGQSPRGIGGSAASQPSRRAPTPGRRPTLRTSIRRPAPRAELWGGPGAARHQASGGTGSATNNAADRPRDRELTH